MTKVSVEVYGHFVKLAGRRGGVIEIDNPTVAGLLAQIEKEWNARFLEAILDKERQGISLFALALVNNDPVYGREGMETRLQDGDRVAFLPPLEGGQRDRDIVFHNNKLKQLKRKYGRDYSR